MNKQRPNAISMARKHIEIAEQLRDLAWASIERSSPIKPIKTEGTCESMNEQEIENVRCENEKIVEPKLHPAKINAWTNYDGTIEVHIMAKDIKEMQRVIDAVTNTFRGY